MMLTMKDAAVVRMDRILIASSEERLDAAAVLGSLPAIRLIIVHVTTPSSQT